MDYISYPSLFLREFKPSKKTKLKKVPAHKTDATAKNKRVVYNKITPTNSRMNTQSFLNELAKLQKFDAK